MSSRIAPHAPHSTKRVSCDVAVRGSCDAAVPMKFKRSAQFGAPTPSNPALDKLPSYVTLPRNRRNRSHSLIANTSTVKQGGLPTSRSPWAVGGPLPATKGLVKSRSSTLFGRQIYPEKSNGHTSQRRVSNSVTLAPNRFGIRHSNLRPPEKPDETRRASLVHEGYSSVRQSTVSCKSIKVCRVSKEDVLQKSKEREQSKLNTYQITPFNKIKINKQDLRSYVVFYEKKLGEKLEDNNLNIALEKRKRMRMEGRLKFLLEDNENMSLKLLGLKQDLGAYLRSTETAV